MIQNAETFVRAIALECSNLQNKVISNPNCTQTCCIIRA